MGNRPKMRVEDRAKQFAPFSALTGLTEALAVKEKNVVEKMELSEDAAVVLDEKMHQVEKGSMITVIYYCRGEYLKVTGMVARIDPVCKLLQIVNTKIMFDDILDLWSED